MCCLRNQYLKYRSWLLGGKCIKNISPPDNYSLIYEDSMEHFNSNFWRYSMDWGIIHPESLDKYFPDTDQFVFNNIEGCDLLALKEPRIFHKEELPPWLQTEDMPNTWVSNWGLGVIQSKLLYKWGWYEAEIKLPIGKAQWPAFWVWGNNAEIDIFEAYSGENPYKFKFEFNLHYPNKTYKPSRFYVSEPTQKYIKYVLHWEEDFLKVYVDGLLVIEIIDPNILEHLNKEQYIVLNTSVRTNSSIKPSNSVMKIKNFKLYQK